MWLIGWPLIGRIQYLRLWSIGFPIRKYRTWSISAEMMQTLRRQMATLQEWKKLMLYQGALYHCHTPAGKLGEVMQFVVPMAHLVAAMNGCHRDAGHQGQQQILLPTTGPGSGGQAWPCRCRRQLASVNNASNMRALMPKHQCSPSLPLLLWSCYM